MSLPSLNAVQERFLKVFDLGRTALTDDTLSLFQTFVIIEMVLAGLYIALNAREDISNISQRVLKIGFFYWIIKEYDWFLQQLLDGFLSAGATAGSASGLTTATLRNPDAIISRAFAIVAPAFEKVFQLQGQSYFGLPTLDNLLVLGCISTGFLALIALAIQVFVTYVEFMVIAAAGFILVPFGIFKPLSFLAEKVFGAIISFGIKLLVLAMIISASTSILDEMALTTSLSWQEAWNFTLISLSLFVISFHAPSTAASLLYGTPALSAGQILPAAYAGSTLISSAAKTSYNSAVSQPSRSVAQVAGAAVGGYEKSRESSSRMASILYGAPKNFASGMVGAAVNNATKNLKTSYALGKFVGGKK